MDELCRNNSLLFSNLAPDIEGIDNCLRQLDILCKLCSRGDVGRAIKKVQDLIKWSDDVLEKLLYSNMSAIGVQH